MTSNLARIGHLPSSPFLQSLGATYVIFALGLVTAYAVELYFIGYENSSLRMLVRFDHQIRYDLFYYLVPFTALYPIFMDFMTFGLHSVSWPWMAWLKDLRPVAWIPSFALQIVFIELGLSFLQYWQHRALHHFPLFWETHKFHHSAEEMTVLSYVRETPFTIAFNSALIALPTALIGTFAVPERWTLSDSIAFGLWTLYTFFVVINQFLVHSNLRLTYGWVGRYFLVSPANHRVHHSALPEHFNTNYSVTHVFWGRLFGTYHEGADPVGQTCPVGYEGNIYNKSKWIADEFFYPMISFFVALYRLVDRWLRARPGVRTRLIEMWNAFVTVLFSLIILVGWAGLTVICWLRGAVPWSRGMSSSRA